MVEKYYYEDGKEKIGVTDRGVFFFQYVKQDKKISGRGTFVEVDDGKLTLIEEGDFLYMDEDGFFISETDTYSVEAKVSNEFKKKLLEAAKQYEPVESRDEAMAY